jgi:2-keto-4-pentenoate hydratase
MDRHAHAGRCRVGRKIGLTSEAIQRQLGVAEPDFGALLSTHVFASGDAVSLSGLKAIVPRIEAEIAFVLDHELRGPGITTAEVLAATRSLIPVFELIDSRIRDWRITLPDTVADNASCLGAVIGAPVDVSRAGPPVAHVVSFGRDDEPRLDGRASAVMGDPALAVAWLANQLAGFDDVLPADEPILSGSFTAALDLVPGRWTASFGESLGRVSIEVIP